MPSYWLEDYVNDKKESGSDVQPDNDAAASSTTQAISQQSGNPSSSSSSHSFSTAQQGIQPRHGSSNQPYAQYQRTPATATNGGSPHKWTADNINTTPRVKREEEAKQYSPVVSESPSVASECPGTERQTGPDEIDSLFGDSDFGGNAPTTPSGEPPIHSQSQSQDQSQSAFPERKDGPGGSLTSSFPSQHQQAPMDPSIEQQEQTNQVPSKDEKGKAEEEERSRTCNFVPTLSLGQQEQPYNSHLPLLCPYRRPSGLLSPYKYTRTESWKMQYDREQALKKRARAAADRAAAQRRFNEEVGVGQMTGYSVDEEDEPLQPLVPHPDCGCGCHVDKCNCHPLHCGCLGCDHREEAERLMREAEWKWGDGEGEEEEEGEGEGEEEEEGEGEEEEYEPPEAEPGQHEEEALQEHGQCCGGGKTQKRCACLPGLCRCVGCEEHGVDEPGSVIPRYTSHRPEGSSPSWTLNPTSEGNTCSCRAGGICRCLPGRCNCGKGQSEPEPHNPSNQYGLTEIPCQCRAGEDYLCAPTKCKCRKTQSAPNLWASQRDDPPSPYRLMAASWGFSYQSRPLHLKLAEMIEPGGEGSTKPSDTPPLSSCGLRPESSSMPAPSTSRQSPILPSRPDTPRPQFESTPSTPYAADSLQDYVQQSVESNPTASQSQHWNADGVHNGVVAPQQDNFQRSIEPEYAPSNQDEVRQSVEPEYPPPNWARESTPAYENRSLTPSPFSGTGDVEMHDVSLGTIVPSGLGREASAPPPDSETRGSVSPQGPVPPPIPDSVIKQPKRGDRRKSGVHGSKVEKRAAIGTKAKPKSRKPTASVGKLVEQAKKENKETAGQKSAAEGPKKPLPNIGGKVSDAVKKIEEQIKQQQEKKQKDGSPLRRSKRTNKGVRRSLGQGSPE